ncbi:efflux RND transporter periplasmic adaptor subunit [bacterium]|nr:efflux RND transporter periplasmic adaptor subunit [bacterium]MBU1995410.1 efflux RND transporter periplasmic adaptor subunit [bacterium]
MENMENIKKITSYKSSGWKFKVYAALFVVMLMGGGYLYFMPQEEKDIYKYITQPLKKDNLNLTVSATGYLEPLESVDVGTEVSGTIEKVYVDYNDLVKKGQMLAQLNKTKYKSSVDKSFASLASAEASLLSAQAQLYQAQTTMERDKILKASTNGALPSQRDWDGDWANYLAAKAGIANANAQVDQARHALVSGKYDLEKTMIFSPIDGIVLVRNIDPGQTVAAAFQTPVLFKIAKDLTQMELQVSIDEADIAKIKAGQKATFSVDAYPQREFEADIRLVRVNSEIVNGVVTYIAVLNVDNSQLLLRPGMSVDADIIVQTLKNALIIPRAALLFTPVEAKTKKMFGLNAQAKTVIDSKPHVWILENLKPKKVYIKVLGNSGLVSAIVSDELNENDDIITTQEKLK